MSFDQTPESGAYVAVGRAGDGGGGEERDGGGEEEEEVGGGGCCGFHCFLVGWLLVGGGGEVCFEFRFRF